MGFEIPQTIATLAFLFSLSLLFTIIFGYSFLYHLFGISTRKLNTSPDEVKTEKEPGSIVD